MMRIIRITMKLEMVSFAIKFQTFLKLLVLIRKQLKRKEEVTYRGGSQFVSLANALVINSFIERCRKSRLSAQVTILCVHKVQSKLDRMFACC